MEDISAICALYDGHNRGSSELILSYKIGDTHSNFSVRQLTFSSSGLELLVQITRRM